MLAVIVALLVFSTAAHHLVPAHAGMPMPGGAGSPSMPGMPHHAGAAHHGMPQADAPLAPRSDQAMPVMAMCLGVVLAGFVLAYVGAILRTPRTRRRTTPARQAIRAARWSGRAACRDGPPVFLRLQVLRT